MPGVQHPTEPGPPSTVTDWLREASSVAVLTGAGISTDSGIPDYRGPRGVWTLDPEAERLSSIEAYLGDPGVRRTAWQRRLSHPAWTAQPNAAHRALVALESERREVNVLSQNIDGLHLDAGSARVLELHGTMRWAECVGCRRRTPMLEVLERVRAGEEDPPCECCGDVLKSATIYFGESLDEELMRRASECAARCDVFLTVGTSLSVFPVAGLCDVALEAGARLVVCNAEPTAYDDNAHAVLRGRIGELLPRLAVAVSG